MTESEAIDGIRECAALRDDAEGRRRAAMTALRGYILAAQEAGVSITQIAQEARLSRQGVYDLLRQPV